MKILALAVMLMLQGCDGGDCRDTYEEEAVSVWFKYKVYLRCGHPKHTPTRTEGPQGNHRRFTLTCECPK